MTETYETINGEEDLDRLMAIADKLEELAKLSEQNDDLYEGIGIDAPEYTAEEGETLSVTLFVGDPKAIERFDPRTDSYHPSMWTPIFPDEYSKYPNIKPCRVPWGLNVVFNGNRANYDETVKKLSLYDDSTNTRAIFSKRFEVTLTI